MSGARQSSKVVAITGGARGIGFETAKELIGRGYRVAIGDIDETRLKEAALELGIDTYARLDVTDPESFRAFLDLVESELGDLDVLINNAGIMPTGHTHEEADAVTRTAGRDQHPRRHLRHQAGAGADAPARPRPHHQHRLTGG